MVGSPALCLGGVDCSPVIGALNISNTTPDLYHIPRTIFWYAQIGLRFHVPASNTHLGGQKQNMQSESESWSPDMESVLEHWHIGSQSTFLLANGD